MGAIFVDDKYEKIIEKIVELELKKDLKRFWSKKGFVEYMTRYFLSTNKSDELEKFVKETFLSDANDSNV